MSLEQKGFGNQPQPNQLYGSGSSMEQAPSGENNPIEHHGTSRESNHTFYEAGEDQISPELSELLIQAKQTEKCSPVSGVLLPNNTVIFTADKVDHFKMCQSRGFILADAIQFSYFPDTPADSFETDVLIVYGHNTTQNTDGASRLFEFLKLSWPELLNPTLVSVFRTESEMKKDKNAIFMDTMLKAKAQQ